MRCRPRLRVQALCCLALLACSATARAQAGVPLQTRALAATCAACHGTGGKAVPGQAMPPLAGLAREAIAAQMLAFRDGTRPATVMHQIAKGYTPAQIDAMAAYFAAQP